MALLGMVATNTGRLEEGCRLLEMAVSVCPGTLVAVAAALRRGKRT